LEISSGQRKFPDFTLVYIVLEEISQVGPAKRGWLCSAPHPTVTGADHTIRTGPLRAAWKIFGGSEKKKFPRKNSKKLFPKGEVDQERISQVGPARFCIRFTSVRDEHRKKYRTFF
jgi:hypothetical protein